MTSTNALIVQAAATPLQLTPLLHLKKEPLLPGSGSSMLQIVC